MKPKSNMDLYIDELEDWVKNKKILKLKMKYSKDDLTVIEEKNKADDEDQEA